MKIYTNKNNCSTLKLLIAAKLAGKKVELVEASLEGRQIFLAITVSCYFERSVSIRSHKDLKKHIYEKIYIVFYSVCSVCAFVYFYLKKYLLYMLQCGSSEAERLNNSTTLRQFHSLHKFFTLLLLMEFPPLKKG